MGQNRNFEKREIIPKKGRNVSEIQYPEPSSKHSQLCSINKIRQVAKCRRLHVDASSPL